MENWKDEDWTGPRDIVFGSSVDHKSLDRLRQSDQA